MSRLYLAVAVVTSLVVVLALVTRRPLAVIADPPAPALTVRILDVGQGDAIDIHNGASRVLVDGGPDPVRLGRLLDSLGVHHDTLDAVILTHAHLDHYGGLPALFASERHLVIRTFFENGDPGAPLLDELRDSVFARVDRGELVYHDTDDPCGDDRPVCVVPLRGGAHLDILRPAPGAADANDRSAAVKLVGPDSASFSMWLAGDAEHAAIRWYEQAGYARAPGMRADILKADHHGSCNGLTPRYLALVRPSWLVASLGAHNEYGHMHAQAKRIATAAGVPWYRTDRNGTVTIRSAGTAGSDYSIVPSRPGRDLSGPSDRWSHQEACREVSRASEPIERDPGMRNAPLRAHALRFRRDAVHLDGHGQRPAVPRARSQYARERVHRRRRDRGADHRVPPRP